MRLRNITGARDVIAESEYVVQEPTEYKGRWKDLFENKGELRVEVGMGKGKFLNEMARRNPHINYIGIEMYSSVLLRALQKMELDPLPNLKFLCIDARILPDVFEKGEVDHIYLNFSDPWPKARHARRRLTSTVFFAQYEKVLAKEGVVEFKTDNRPLFEFSLEQVEEAGWKLQAFTFDLHHDEIMNQGNVMTEYEEKFSAQGNPIHKLIATRIY